MLADKRLFFLGAGSMSEAILKGLTATAVLPPSQIMVCNRLHLPRLEELQEHYGVVPSLDKSTDIATADIIVLAVKPFDVAQALGQVHAALSPGQLLISVAAGVATAPIEARLPAGMPVIRTMPNTSSFVQESATAICRGRWATPEHLEMARQLFAAIGTVAVVDEAAMDAVTGLSGSGPAYIYYVAEALLAAGAAVGLPEETSRELLLQTLYGAARMLRETGKGPAELRRQVTSPNGTTMAGIAILDEREVHQAFLHAVKRATARAREMGEALADNGSKD
jgi:pyrroline-5-carboxylate reductase